ncbi:hypothetical protein V6N13_118582 [Hibiscus sabdariffa]
MAEMKGISIDAYNWLKAKDPYTWSKSHFSTRSKCDILLNNYSEYFNKIIRTQMMHGISKKAEAAHKYTGPLCPKIQKKMDILIEQVARCWPSHAEGERYEVAFGPFDQHVVNLQTRDYSCRKSGLTCWPKEYVDQCYHTSTQIAIYSNLIYAIIGANQWEPIPTMEPILSPVQRRPSGRPKKQRKKVTDEQNNGLSRGKRTLEIKCTKCGKPDHNVRTCKGWVRSNIRHNKPLVATPIASAPLTPPKSPHLSPPVPAPSTIDRPTKLSFQRSTKVHLKRTIGGQISPQQPTQQQPTPYQVVRRMMQQTTNSENVLPTSQESIGSFKPKTN